MNQQTSYYTGNHAHRQKPSVEYYAGTPSNTRSKSNSIGYPNSSGYQHNSYSYGQPEYSRQSSAKPASFLKYLNSDEEEVYPNYPTTFSTPKNYQYSNQQHPLPGPSMGLKNNTIFSDHSNYRGNMAYTSSDELPPMRLKQPSPAYRNHPDPLSHGVEDDYYAYPPHSPYDPEMEFNQYARHGYFTPKHSLLHSNVLHSHHPATPHGYPGTQPLPSPSHKYMNGLYLNPEEPPRRLNSQYVDFSYQDYSEPISEYVNPPMLNTSYVLYPYAEDEGPMDPMDPSPSSVYHRPQMSINTSFENDGFGYERSRTTRHEDFSTLSYAHTHIVSPSPKHSRSGINTPRAHLPPFIQETLPATHREPIESVRGNEDMKSFIDSCPLGKVPPYQEIWESLRHSRKPCPAQCITPEMEVYIHGQIDEGIEHKKQCHFKKARTIFVDLIISYPSYLQIWLEFTRLEMECGEYENASHVLEAALLYHKHNELLLQKQLRVEERLNHIDPITNIIDGLKGVNSQKAIKIIIEAIAVVARMGYERQAAKYYKDIIDKTRFYTGNYYMEEMLFEEHYGNYTTLKKMIEEALTNYPKYGPLWFYCFELIEHDYTVMWEKTSLKDRLSCEQYDKYMEEARKSLTKDLLWKVYFIQVQFWCRAILYMRSAVMHDCGLYDELKKCEVKLWEQIHEHTEYCMRNCASNLHWKVYMIFGRFSALSGYQIMAIKLFRKAYHCAPEKSRQQVVLDYSKAAFFINHQENASDLLKGAELKFQNEWKLVLERIQQLVQQGCSNEALKLNKEALKNHIGAGRLWSSCIQLTHQLFGPKAALKEFKVALRHVAKSGEVWCEGCRIYMNPCSTLFSPSNALKCLNYAVFFTPQYGDSFIEIIRLMMICSDTFLVFHALPSPISLANILCAHTPILHFIKRYSFYDPNYGPLWFRCKEFLLAPAKEVLYRSMTIVALEIALNAQLYYDALVYKSSEVAGKRREDKIPMALRTRFTTAIRPDYMYDDKVDNNQYRRKVQILYGASQLEF